jgi:hypothetical protein
MTVLDPARSVSSTQKLRRCRVWNHISVASNKTDPHVEVVRDVAVTVARVVLVVVGGQAARVGRRVDGVVREALGGEIRSNLTVVTSKASNTAARVGVIAITASTTVLAGVGRAVVRVGLAIVANIACSTIACVSVYAVDALAAILAKVIFAIIDVVLAVHAIESCSAITCVGVDTISASAAVLARVGFALINVGTNISTIP